MTYGTADISMSATNSLLCSCCLPEHLVQMYQMSKPAIGYNNKYS